MIKIKDSNVTIMVKDMNKAISFYESIGLTLKNRWGDNYAMIAAPGITLGIHPDGDKEAGSGSVSVGLFVDDIKEAKQLLDRNKISYEYQEDGKSGLYLHLKDHDGTILYFVQPMW